MKFAVVVFPGSNCDHDARSVEIASSGAPMPEGVSMGRSGSHSSRYASESATRR
jgi:hypothetical protein